MGVRFFFTVASPFVVSRAAHDFPVLRASTKITVACR